MGACEICFIPCFLLIILVICSDGLSESSYKNLKAIKGILRSRSFEDDGDFKSFLKNAGVRLPGQMSYYYDLNRYGKKYNNIDRFQNIKSPKIDVDVAEPKKSQKVKNGKSKPFTAYRIITGKSNKKQSQFKKIKLGKRKYRPYYFKSEQSNNLNKIRPGKKGKKKLLLKKKGNKKKNLRPHGDEAIKIRNAKSKMKHKERKHQRRPSRTLSSRLNELINPLHDLTYPDPPIILIEKKIPLGTDAQSLETYTKADHDKFLEKNNKHIQNQPQEKNLDNNDDAKLNGHDSTGEILENYQKLNEETKDDPIVILNGKAYKVNVGNVKTRDQLTPFFKNVRLVRRVVPAGRSHSDIEYNPQMKGYFKPLMKLANPAPALLDIDRKPLANERDEDKDIDKVSKVKRRHSDRDPYFSLYSTNGFQESTKPTTKAQKYNYWNYWSYKKTIYQDNCPYSQALHNGICIRIPEHRKRHVMNNLKYINKKK